MFVKLLTFNKPPYICKQFCNDVIYVLAHDKMLVYCNIAITILENIIDLSRRIIIKILKVLILIIISCKDINIFKLSTFTQTSYIIMTFFSAITLTLTVFYVDSST